MATEADPTVSRRRRSRLLTPFRVLLARPQLFVASAVGIACGLLLPHELRPVTRAVIGWNVGVVAYFCLIAILMSRSTHETIRERAKMLDEGRGVMLVLATAAACAAFGAIIVELGAVKQAESAAKFAIIGLTIVTVINSWMFLHLTFAFHYAHEFYADEERTPEDPWDTRGGLVFPGTTNPQYVDFMYFSFIIGVACQTADVATSSATMRATALAHGVIAFFYNTTILALMVNIASQFV